MNKYEVMFIVKPAEEEATNAVIEKVEALIAVSYTHLTLPTILRV